MSRFTRGQTVHYAGNGSIRNNLRYIEPLNEYLSWCLDLDGEQILLDTVLLSERTTP